ncbi:MAG TPA: 1,4-dihydroxy-6-naphthoate synthase [Salinivirga sp.]|uniref:menaquinone biosynthesis family protein n=1 Tax=Salinivirga sp. TaxID=1970192 RepID=UPI002B45ABD0|nr:1,4-dihydroxy-6-naphthoate synthase [Salinivirga sp.]HKK60698.1 1,4-dihydroxy-6-naphthoate synthase [Salinivirga sp.]
MTLNLAFSTCPNDTFMFDALVHKRIDAAGFNFNVKLADIEELNHQANQQINDITKISINAFASLTEHYQMLNSGAALGFGNGPLVISKHKIYPDELHDAIVAIPGEHTTANLLLNILFPEAQRKKTYLFSDIEEAVLSGEADAGLIIHETRFSYQKKGLLKVADLGEIWEKEINLPLPLGGIAVRRTLPRETKLKIQSLISTSVQFAFQNPAASKDYVKSHARDLDEDVMRKHITLYVNDYSANCGKDGEAAIQFLIKKAAEIKKHPITTPVFL